MSKRTPTTKDIALLRQLFDQNQIVLKPEFQRDSVWTRAAKAYLIDTILNDRPISLLYFQRMTSAQTGRPSYAVIDGQQRLRAILDFLNDRFRLVESKNPQYRGKKFSELAPRFKDQINSYDLYISELTGYSDADIRDMFVRMNKYVVKLAPQEVRHAEHEGRFARFVERIGAWELWRTKRIFTRQQIRRMRPVEFTAELTILILEGPQDKKKAIDLYYKQFKKRFPDEKTVERRLRAYFDWINNAIPALENSRFRKPVDLYGLFGALELVTKEGSKLKSLDPQLAGRALEAFERSTRAKIPKGNASRYLAAASRQTDNINPRNTRIEIISRVLSEA